MALDICILLRVYSRLEDLAVCVEAMKRHWTRHRYRIIVVGNGQRDGYRIPREIAADVHEVIELDANYGHQGGSRQLLLEGARHIPADCSFTVLLEADTWVFTDALVDKYVRRMIAEGLVWSSAEWVEKWFSLALDFAIVDSRFLRDQPALFDFPRHGECYVC